MNAQTKKMMMTDETTMMRNGVNVTQLFDTISTIKGMPSVASFRFRARNRWMDGGHNRTTIDGFYGANEEHTTKTYMFDNDEPPALLGRDMGANPVEFLLHALAGCLTTSLVYHAAARGITLHEVESRLEGDIDLRGFLGMDPTVPNGYKEIRVTFNVKGDAPEETIEELMQIAQNRSPVFYSVTHAVPVKVMLAKD